MSQLRTRELPLWISDPCLPPFCKTAYVSPQFAILRANQLTDFEHVHDGVWHQALAVTSN